MLPHVHATEVASVHLGGENPNVTFRRMFTVYRPCFIVFDRVSLPRCGKAKQGREETADSLGEDEELCLVLNERFLPRFCRSLLCCVCGWLCIPRI